MGHVCKKPGCVAQAQSWWTPVLSAAAQHVSKTAVGGAFAATRWAPPEGVASLKGESRMELMALCTHWFTTKQGKAVPCRLLWATPEGQARVRFWSAERLRTLAGLVREPSAEKGHAVIGLGAEGLETEEETAPGVATLQLRHEQSGQCVQFEGCASGATDTISCRATGEVGCKGAREGDRLLVRVRSPDKVVTEQFTGFDDTFWWRPITHRVQWARQATRAQVVPRRPEGSLLSSMRGEFQALQLASEEWEDAW